MSVGIQDNKNLGVVRVTLTTLPQLHPFSAASNAAQNYICYGIDTKGFQVEIDLQAMPPGVTLSQLQADQVWWVEKRTSLYRLFLYAGTFNRTINQVNSTTPLPTSSSTGVPTGTLLDFAGSNAPTGYLLCDGSSYSTTTYSGLFSVIGYTWGGSGGSFSTPDLRGRTTIGAGSGTGLTLRALATYSGEENHVLVSGETPLVSHTHAFTVASSTGSTTASNTTGSLTIPASTYSTGSNTTGIGVSSSPTSLTAAGTTASSTTGVTDVTPVNQVASNYGVVTAGTGLGYQGRLYVNGTGANITDTITDPGHTHTASLSVTGGITSTVTDLGHLHSIPTMTTNGNLTIPSLNFTVPAQTGLTTSGNTATTATGHNNMQPYAVVTKIIKY